MSTSNRAIVKKAVIGLVFGLASTAGMIGTANAASDYKVIAKHEVRMGGADHHEASRVIRFHLPADFDARSNVVLQMNIRSTNKSKYSAIYLNPYDLPMHEFGSCDSAHHDSNDDTRVGYLPYAGHEETKPYHKTIDGGYLKPGDNTMLVCSRNSHGDTGHEIDNFYVKDIVVHYREYKPAPEFCSSVYAPVCGVDGQSYSNACSAEAAHVEIHHEGNCGS